MHPDDRVRMLIVASILVAGCNRYTMRPMRADECPPTAAATETLHVERAGMRGAIVGRVMGARGEGPVDLVDVIIEPPRRFTRTDNGGNFRIDSLEPGTYSLLFRRVGYEHLLVDSIRIDSAAGALVHAPLAITILDGCPGFAGVMERKPWWKWW